MLHPTLHFYIWHKLPVTKTVASMAKRKFSTIVLFTFLPCLHHHHPCVAVCLYLWAGWPGRVTALHPRPHASPPARPERVRRSPGGEESPVQPWPGPEWHPECDNSADGDILTNTEINTHMLSKTEWKDRVLSKKKQEQWKIVLCFAVFNPKSSVLEMIRVQ